MILYRSDEKRKMKWFLSIREYYVVGDSITITALDGTTIKLLKQELKEKYTEIFIYTDEEKLLENIKMIGETE